VRTGGHDRLDILARPNVTCDALIAGPFASRDTLRVVAESAPPGSVSVTQPSGSTPGSVRITRPAGPVQVVSYESIGSVSTTVA
jgi:hypothetical protein